VTVRINIDGNGDGETTVSVHGWIEGDDEARELLRVVRDTRAPVVLDLGELQTADDSGLMALNTLSSEGARLTGASDFIKLLLRSNDRTSPLHAGETNGGAP
jgi:anti-anti-sigma regulatory factor